MPVSLTEDILILAKTYPIPSAKYAETSCVAGINAKGEMRRLYPIPFRLMDDEHQFKKWQWVNARVFKSNTDHRPESYKVYVDTVQQGDSISTAQDWLLRREWVNRIPTSSQDQRSMYLVKPYRIDSLQITPESKPDWDDDEVEKLMLGQNQTELFQESPKTIRQLRKLPYEFHYHYTLETPEGLVQQRHKIADWEAGAFYWNCVKAYGSKWEKPFRQKLEEEFSSKDLMFLIGNLHRFQHRWIIGSLIYPPKITQPSLF